jgi:Outer membrane protein beta-barrel domain
MFRKTLLLLFNLGIFMLSYSQMKFGVKGGITQSSVKEDLNMPDNEYSLQTGFQIGVFAEKQLTGNLVFRPALQLTQKGYKSVVGNPGGPFYWNRDLLTNYIELPLDLLYKFRLNNASNFFVGTGPILSYGINGRLKATLVTTDNNQQLHTKKSTDNNIFKNNIDQRFDLGWNANAGIQSCRMSFNLSYNHGITNLVKDDNQSLKNRSFAFTVGYTLR